MAKKQAVKLSEARILMFLKTAELKYRWTQHISNKLQMDYGYCRRILSGMIEKGWIRKELNNYSSKVFYRLTKVAPITICKEVIQ